MNTSSQISTLEMFGSVRRAIQRLAAKKLKALKLGTKQVIVLRLISKKGQCSLTELAEASDSDLAAVSRMIASLEKNNWLTRARDPNDARQAIVKLGPKAKRRLPEIEAVVDEIADEVLHSLSSSEVATFRSLLSKMEKELAGAVDFDAT
jgi:DNA-binding MarR family transcriptional regulator